MADSDPDALEKDIARTRDELARTVDAIADRVSPKRVVRRSLAQARDNVERAGPGPLLVGVGAVIALTAIVIIVRRRRRR